MRAWTSQTKTSVRWRATSIFAGGVAKVCLRANLTYAMTLRRLRAGAACSVAHDKTARVRFTFISVIFVGGGLVLDNKLYTGKAVTQGRLAHLPSRVRYIRTAARDVAVSFHVEAMLAIDAGESHSHGWNDPAVRSHETSDSWLDAPPRHWLRRSVPRPV